MNENSVNYYSFTVLMRYTCLNVYIILITY